MSRARIACLTFPHLSLILVWRAHPELRSEPVVIAGHRAGQRHLVLAASPPALERGARVGQECRQAELSCPEALRLEIDEAAVAELRREAREALSGHSPLVEWNDDSSAYLDLGGRTPDHLSESTRAAKCGRSLQQVLGVPPSVGVGQSRFSASAAAQMAGPGRVRLVADGKVAEFLASWPVEALPLPPVTVERLIQFGLRSCGDCVVLPLPDLQRQFGPEGLQLYRLCRGQDSALLQPWREPLPCGVRRVLAGVVDDVESLRFGAAELSRSLARELALAGRAAGRVRLVLRGEDAPGLQPQSLADSELVCWEEISPPAPVASENELQGLILSLFEKASPRVAVAVVELEALDLVAPPVQQGGLWQADPASIRAIELAVARLHQRFGKGLVWRVALRVGSSEDLPEERLAWRSG